ncbi:MAG: hypothetical protein GXX94_11655 [Chloroflexi bacterium]|nr:hypothetical protein [Chloroflexota bacterium]
MQDISPITGSELDLNTASEDDLVRLLGVAPHVAAAIIAHRDEFGPLDSTAALQNLPGMDAATLERLGEHLARAQADAEPSSEAAQPEDMVSVSTGVGREHTPDLAPMDEDATLEARPEGSPLAGVPVEGLPADVHEEDVSSCTFASGAEAPDDAIGLTEGFQEPQMELPALEDADGKPRDTEGDACAVESDSPGGVQDHSEGAEAVVCEGAHPDGDARDEADAKSEASETYCDDWAVLPSDQPEQPEADELVRAAAGTRAGSESAGSAVPSGTAAGELPEASDAGREPAPVGSMAPSDAPKRRSWHDIGLIALGGLLGILGTLLVFGALGGTLRYAPRSLVGALSDNMATMQQNQETTWTELQSLAERSATLEARITALEDLRSRVSAIEEDAAARQAQLSVLGDNLKGLSSDLAELEMRHSALIAGVEGRLDDQESALALFEQSIDDMQGQVSSMEERLVRYQGFFDGLMELLRELSGEEGDEPELDL